MYVRACARGCCTQLRGRLCTPPGPAARSPNLARTSAESVTDGGARGRACAVYVLLAHAPCVVCCARAPRARGVLRVCRRGWVLRFPAAARTQAMRSVVLASLALAALALADNPVPANLVGTWSGSLVVAYGSPGAQGKPFVCM